MVRSLPRRPLLTGALVIPLLAPAAARAQGIEPAEAPRRAERWRDLKAAIFDDRPTEPAGGHPTPAAAPRPALAPAAAASASFLPEPPPRGGPVTPAVCEK